MTRSESVQPVRGRPILLAILLGLSLVAVACGGSGSDDASGNGGGASESSAAPSDGDSERDSSNGDSVNDDSSNGDSANSDSSSAGGVTVTIGDTTWEFDVENGIAVQCAVFAGEATFGSGIGVDTATRLSFQLNDVDAQDESSVSITADDGSYEWVAGSNDGRTFEEGTSQVDSAEFDGQSVSGTATFIDVATEERTPVEGSFDITCPK